LLKPGSNIAQPPFSEEREKAWLALLLSWVAGFADAFGFLMLGRIFTSHISGNSVAAGAEAGQGHWRIAAQHAWPIVCFVIGFFFAAVLETVCARLGMRRRLSAGLVPEVVLLWMFFIFGDRWVHSADLASQVPVKYYILVAMLAFAMGTQNASLRRVRGQSVHTGYVTGMLINSADNAVKALLAVYDQMRNRVGEPLSDCIKRMIFYAGVWLSFTGGAFCGGIGECHWSFSSLLAPLIVLMCVIACDLVRPVHD
jgi:uncharacterized membrane protein YoaK (UPF0700 family)